MDAARHRFRDGHPLVHPVSRADRAHDRRARRAGSTRVGDRLRDPGAQPSHQSPLPQPKWHDSADDSGAARPPAPTRVRRLARDRLPATSTRAFCGRDRPPRERRLMSTVTTREGTQVSDNGDADAVPASSHALFVSPHGRRDGFWASIRGHVLDLADPSSGHGLAPTPDDLFIVSIAAELAWTTRRILRAAGLPDDVSVSANWRTNTDLPNLADIDLTVRLPRRAEAASA